MNENSMGRLFCEGKPHIELEERQLDHSYLVELIRVLKPHRAGLRRWSIMRTIRKNRETAGLPIPHKIEDGVERVFRHHCADTENFKKRDGTLKAGLFHWPQGKSGGVWAVYPDRAEVWLKAESDPTFNPIWD